MDTTINTSYSMFPSEYRKHWIDEHHSTDHIATEASEGYTLVIECEGKIIGTGNVFHKQIQSLFVHSEYQRRGYGTELIHRLEEYARKEGVDTLRLSALTPSKQFFEALGYRIISENQFQDDNLRQFKYYVMEKSI
jgi:N-acetylglutamate synthase-like GNAT family acetyltransferase